jgi:hypothetical protein
MIKAKLLTRYPAAVEATAPIVSEFTNGVLELSYDSSGLQQSISPPDGSKLVVRSGAIYQEVPTTNFVIASIANNTLFGNVSGATAQPTSISGEQTAAILPVVIGDSGSGGVKGLVPAPAAGDAAAGKYLDSDGTWSVPAAGSFLPLSGGTLTGTLTLNADPATALEAVTKQYADQLAQGIAWKTVVRVATTTAGTLATSFENGDTIDGVVLATNDRILIKDQAAPAENGIYTVNGSGAPTRATDMDTWSEVVSAATAVTAGTANVGKSFLTTAAAGGTLNTTAINFIEFSAATTYSAGSGLTLTGTSFSANTTGTTTGVVGGNIAVRSTATTGQVLRSSGVSGNEAAWGAVNLASSDAVTGTLPVANGGTGGTTSTGSGAVVLASSPTLAGAPLAPTAAADTNTTQVATTAFVVGQASAVSPVVDGVATVGTSLRYARADHVHPTDTSRAPTASPTFTGAPAGPTASVDTNTTQLATTAFVVGQAGVATPVVDGVAAVGTSLRYARQDHVHPTDTSRAALASPTFTGTPAAPTAAADTNTTQVATTAFVVGQAGVAAPIVDGVATVGTSLKYARQDHVHPYLDTIDKTGPAWASYSNIYSGFTSNINSYPVTARFGSNAVGCAEAMAGLVDVPSTSAAGNHSAGVAGYARSASTSQGGVGTFGAGMCTADGVSAWAFNSIITNAAIPNPGNGAGYDTCTLYGFELDFNIMKKGGATPTGPLRGLYFIGASEVQPNSPTVNTIEIDGLNFTGTKIPWKQAFVVVDGAAQTFANIGSISVNTGATTSDGQPIKASAYSGGVQKAGQIYLNSLGNWWLEPSAGSGIDTPSGTIYQVNSVPVADNLGWTAWTPTVAPQTGAFTTLGTVTARYKRLGKTIQFNIKIAITTNGTGADSISFTLPGGFTPQADFSCSGYESTAYGASLQCRGLAGANSVAVLKYDSAYPGANNATLVITGAYEIT